MATHRNEKSGICGICSAGCGVIVSYDQAGRISAVRADETSPFGMICKVGEHSPEIVYSGHRVAHPFTEGGAEGLLRLQEHILGRGI